MRRTLLTIGGQVFPMKYVFINTYRCQREIQDLDTTRTTTGHLQRNILDHESYVVTFNTKPMWGEQHDEMWTFFKNAYLDGGKGRKVHVVAWCPELVDYVTGDFYIPTPIIPIDRFDEKRQDLFYNSYEIQMIMY